MKRHLFTLFAIITLFCASLPATTFASPIGVVTQKGLLIAPVRQFLSGNAGHTVHSTFTVANHTSAPLNVTFSVEQFSVADYTYNYTFETHTNDWLRLEQTGATLQPDQTDNIPYAISVPPGSAPGGRYYTLLASASVASRGVSSTIQAADLLYLTVNGKLTIVSHLQGSSISRLVFGSSIPFNLQPVNTGNVYSFVYVAGQLHGLFVRPAETSAAHLLMPGKVRTLSSSIPSPVLPGIYHATYGYKTTAGWVIQRSAWIVFIPPWSIALLLAALLFAGKLFSRHKKDNDSSDQN